MNTSLRIITALALLLLLSGCTGAAVQADLALLARIFLALGLCGVASAAAPRHGEGFLSTFNQRNSHHVTAT
jgi:hypothetical protein